MGKRATRKEVEERVRMVTGLLAKGTRIGQIRQILRGQFGITKRQANRYLQMAYEELRRELDRDVEQLRSECYARYLEVYSHPDASPRDKVEANKGVTKLLGLNLPTKLAITTSSADENPLNSKHRQQALEDDEVMETAHGLLQRFAGYHGNSGWTGGVGDEGNGKSLEASEAP